jgi:hypothetical protein
LEIEKTPKYTNKSVRNTADRLMKKEVSFHIFSFCTFFTSPPPLSSVHSLALPAVLIFKEELLALVLLLRQKPVAINATSLAIDLDTYAFCEIERAFKDLQIRAETNVFFFSRGVLRYFTRTWRNNSFWCLLRCLPRPQDVGSPLLAPLQKF